MKTGTETGSNMAETAQGPVALDSEKDAARRESAVLKFMSTYSILLILVGMVVLVAVLSGGVSLRIVNLLNVLRQISVIGIIALGVTMCIITAGIDLSSGAVVAMSRWRWRACSRARTRWTVSSRAVTRGRSARCC